MPYILCSFKIIFVKYKNIIYTFYFSDKPLPIKKFLKLLKKRLACPDLCAIMSILKEMFFIIS